MPGQIQNITFFIETGGPGGAEQVVVALASEMKARGLNVSVITCREGWLSETLKARGLRHHILPSERSLDISFPFRIARLLREEKSEVLHSHLLDSNFYGTLAAKIAGIPHLGTEHGDVHHTKRKRFLRAKLRTMALLGTRLSAVSEFTKRRLIELGLSAEQVEVVYNPLNSSSAIDETVRRERRKALGIEEEFDTHWCWIHVANMRPVKDQRTLLRGFKHSLVTSEHRQTLCIIGDGEEHDALKQIVADEQIADSVRFLGFQTDVEKWLWAADGFVLSSLSEAMPMSLLEAAAAGLYIVATNVGGIPELVSNGTSGSLVPAGDPAALGEALSAVLDDVHKSKNQAAQLRSVVRATYSAPHIVDRYLALYKSL